MAYDGLGRLVTQVADAGVGGIAQTTVYGYDRLGRQTSITGYADGATAQTTLYVYDRLGRVVWVMYPDVQFLHFGYNEGGKVIERTDQMDNQTTYSYDRMGRMAERKYYSVAGYYVHDPNDPGSNPLLDGTPLYANDPNVIETFSYDGMGRMLSATKTQEGSAISNTEYDYSDLGPVDTIEETHFGGTTQQIVCGYDQWGNLDELTYPDDSSITLTADARGRIDTINRSATTLVSYNYVGSRVSRRTYPVGGSDDVIYDINYNNSGWSTRHYTYQDATAIADFGYSHDDNGNITEIAYDHRTNDPCQVYGYDDLDRLTTADYFAGYPTGDETFDYDKVGNRLEVQQGQTTQDYTVDNLTNQYTAIDAQSVSHDDAGNLTEDHRGYSYQYDYENRLIKIEDGANVVAEYAYDALGRRIRKIDHVASETTLYYYNQKWQTLCETNENDVVQRCYIYGNFIDEPLMMVDVDDHYYVHDHLFSTAALLDESGNVLERYEYDAYGRPYFYNSSFTLLATQASAHNNSLLFTSRPADLLNDGDLSLQDNRHRVLEFETGRWLQRDPLGVVPNGYLGNTRFTPTKQYVDGVNGYEYVKSNSIISTDYLGLWCGITVRQIDIDLRNGDMGHRWIEGCNSGFGWWPIKDVNLGSYLLGTPGEVVVPDFYYKLPYDRLWVVGKKGSGIMRAGKKAGTPCKCINECEDVCSCIKSMAVNCLGGQWGDDNTNSGSLSRHHSGYYFNGDCRDWAEAVIGGCCLKKIAEKVVKQPKK